ncbi:MAG: hypothetical protein K9N11_07030 [Lentisphaeria bacterium]|nr:hypothetical protein [Candidatus Neomarinimicrobiota bacterium]MCF7842590.1 hypothetical protein [Lentisphaeria bacterium]
MNQKFKSESPSPALFITSAAENRTQSLGDFRHDLLLHALVLPAYSGKGFDDGMNNLVFYYFGDSCFDY